MNVRVLSLCVVSLAALYASAGPTTGFFPVAPVISAAATDGDLLSDDSDEEIIIDEEDTPSVPSQNSTGPSLPGSDTSPGGDSVFPSPGMPADIARDSARTYQNEGRGYETRNRYPGGRDASMRHMPSKGADSAVSGTESAVIEAPVIEEERSINFARNLKEYRSPKRAMFMSLLLPGLGQAYANRKVKAIAFGVVEAAIIGTSAYFSRRGRLEKESAHRFADTWFDTDKFMQYYHHLETYIPNSTTFKNSEDIEDIQSSIIYDTLDLRNDKYGLIQSETMVQGWKDCEPVLDNGLENYIVSNPEYSYVYEPYQRSEGGVAGQDTTWLFYRYSIVNNDTLLLDSLVYGYSAKQYQYNDMMKESESMYRVSRNMILVLLLNHVISAADALISAKGHNDRLLGKETFWQRINLDQQMALTATGLQTSLGVRVRF